MRHLQAQIQAVDEQRGEMTFAGLAPNGSKFTFNPADIVNSENAIRGSYMGSCVPVRDIPRFIELYRQGRLPVDKLINRSIGFDEIIDAACLSRDVDPTVERGQMFAGIALEGAGVTMDRKANARFYGSPDMSPEKIFDSSPNIAPNIANTFVQVLTAQTLRLPKPPCQSMPTWRDNCEKTRFGLGWR